MKPGENSAAPYKSVSSMRDNPPNEIVDNGNLMLGLWHLIDPKISMASVSSMFLGTCAASMQGQLDWQWLILTVIGILFLEAAKNASGDVFDYDSGADISVSEEDRSPFSGGKRVIVDGLITRSQTIVAAAIFYSLGIASGLTIAIFHEPKILVVGVIGVTLAYFYNAPPAKLSYRGLGEVAVAITYGPLICCGTYLVLSHEISTAVVLLSIPLGLLIAAFLVINEFPDRHADRDAGKLNLVVRLGYQKSRWLFLYIIVVSYVVILLLPLADLPQTCWLGFTGLPFGFAAANRVFATEKTSSLIEAQRWMLLSFVLAACGLGVGLLI